MRLLHKKRLWHRCLIFNTYAIIVLFFEHLKHGQLICRAMIKKFFSHCFIVEGVSRFFVTFNSSAELVKTTEGVGCFRIVKLVRKSKVAYGGGEFFLIYQAHCGGV